MTKIITIVTAVLILSLPTVAGAQSVSSAEESPRAEKPVGIEDARPRLIQATKPQYNDRVATIEEEVIYFRSGSSVPLPVSAGTPLVLRLESGLSTSGMNRVPMMREIPLRSPILTEYAQVIAPKDILVETRITGVGSGFTGRAELSVEPQTIYVEIDSYVLVGEHNGQRVFLKPGKWAIVLHCSILAIENPDGRSWYARSENEGQIKGGAFGFNSSPNSEDHAGGLLYLPPYGPIIYGLTQIKGLVGLVFKRPNIKLPERTEIHFRVDRMEATYLAAPIPKGPAKISYQ